MLHRRKVVLGAAGAGGAWLGGIRSARAAEDLRIIVANPPGGLTDLVARALAQGIQSRTGQVVVVDNRPGAGGMIGVQGLLAAPADGRVLLLTTLASLIAPALQRRTTDVLAEIEPIALIASGGSLLLVSEKVQATDLTSFIRLAQQNPGKLSYASGGMGSTAHLMTEHLKARLGIDLLHVPYKGGAAAALAMRTAEVDVTIIDEANAAPLLKDGKVRVIAQTGLRPLASFPTVTRLAEVAPGFDASFWMGLSARKGTPVAQLDRLHGLVTDILQKDMQELVRRAGLAAGSGSRADFGAFMAKEQVRWHEVIKANGITLD